MYGAIRCKIYTCKDTYTYTYIHREIDTYMKRCGAAGWPAVGGMANGVVRLALAKSR